MGRKAFKFYRSYYDVAMELSDKDFVSFMKALLNRQFNGFETELTGMAKFAYLSQKHSIDAQVEGFEAKTGVALCNEGAMQGGIEGDIKGAIVQEKEKEKEKVQEKEEEKGLTVFVKNDFDLAMDDFIEMRMKIKKPLTNKAKVMIKNKLQELAPNDTEMKIKILNQSVMNCWQGIFPIAESKQKEYGKSGAKSSVNDFIEKIQTIKTNL